MWYIATQELSTKAFNTHWTTLLHYVIHHHSRTLYKSLQYPLDDATALCGTSPLKNSLQKPSIPTGRRYCVMWYITTQELSTKAFNTHWTTLLHYVVHHHSRTLYKSLQYPLDDATALCGTSPLKNSLQKPSIPTGRRYCIMWYITTQELSTKAFNTHWTTLLHYVVHHHSRTLYKSLQYPLNDATALCGTSPLKNSLQKPSIPTGRRYCIMWYITTQELSTKAFNTHWTTLLHYVVHRHSRTLYKSLQYPLDDVTALCGTSPLKNSLQKPSIPTGRRYCIMWYIATQELSTKAFNTHWTTLLHYVVHHHSRTLYKSLQYHWTTLLHYVVHHHSRTLYKSLQYPLDDAAALCGTSPLKNSLQKPSIPTGRRYCIMWYIATQELSTKAFNTHWTTLLHYVVHHHSRTLYKSLQYPLDDATALCGTSPLKNSLQKPSIPTERRYCIMWYIATQELSTKAFNTHWTTLLHYVVHHHSRTLYKSLQYPLDDATALCGTSPLKNSLQKPSIPTGRRYCIMWYITTQELSTKAFNTHWTTLLHYVVHRHSRTLYKSLQYPLDDATALCGTSPLKNSLQKPSIPLDDATALCGTSPLKNSLQKPSIPTGRRYCIMWYITTQELSTKAFNTHWTTLLHYCHNFN